MDKILLKLLASYFRSSVALSKLGQTPLSFPFSSVFSSGDSDCKFQVCYIIFVSEWQRIRYVVLFFTFYVSLLFNAIPKFSISFALSVWFPEFGRIVV